jgi:hypothetical protein
VTKASPGQRWQNRWGITRSGVWSRFTRGPGRHIRHGCAGGSRFSPTHLIKTLPSASEQPLLIMSGEPPPELSSTPRAERLTFSPRWAVPACSMYQAPMPTTMQVIATTEGWPLPAVTLRRQGRAQPCADRRDRVGYERGIPRGRALTLTNELKALESSPEGFHIQ